MTIAAACLGKCLYNGVIFVALDFTFEILPNVGIHLSQVKKNP